LPVLLPVILSVFLPVLLPVLLIVLLLANPTILEPVLLLFLMPVLVLVYSLSACLSAYSYPRLLSPFLSIVSQTLKKVWGMGVTSGGWLTPARLGLIQYINESI
jgi:hypothetical protein